MSTLFASYYDKYSQLLKSLSMDSFLTSRGDNYFNINRAKIIFINETINMMNI